MELVTAITALLTASTGLVGAGIVLVRILKKEPKKAAMTATQKLAQAAEDGVITAEELREIAESVDAEEAS